MKMQEFKTLSPAQKSKMYRTVETPLERRIILTHLLLAATDIMSAMGVDPLPFRDLSRSLIDLDSGIQAPLLKAVKVPNRPVASSKQLGLISFAAVAMELYMRSGLKRMEAANKVATDLAKLGLAKESGIKIANWRTKCKGGNKSENIEANRYFRMLEKSLKDCSDPKEAAEHLLSSLPKIMLRGEDFN